MTPTTTTTTSDRSGLARALWAVVLVGVVSTVVALFLFGGHAALSVAVGALVAGLNLWAIALVVRGLLGEKRGSTPWALIAVAKFTLLIGGLFFLLKSGWVDLLPLLVGYGALPLGIVAGQFGGPMPAGEET